MYNIKEILKENANADNAVKMKRYMKNHFDFLGIQAGKRKELSKPLLKELKDQDIDWTLVEDLWEENEREFQYIACDYLFQQRKKLQKNDLEKLKKLALKKSWWDSIDSIDRSIAYLVEQYPELNTEILQWSKSDNIWLRRISIIYQRLSKEKTDIEILEKVIINNLNSTEFFINKGIGWALRSYSKVNPNWVENFIDKHQDGLSKLSIREASKYL